MDNKSDIETMKKDLDDVKDTLTKLTIAIDKLTNVCSRMDNHINFVEDTYDSLKFPLNYAKCTIEKIMGLDEKLLK
jgi:archaellum component FlaC